MCDMCAYSCVSVGIWCHGMCGEVRGTPGCGCFLSFWFETGFHVGIYVLQASWPWSFWGFSCLRLPSSPVVKWKKFGERLHLYKSWRIVEDGTWCLSLAFHSCLYRELTHTCTHKCTHTCRHECTLRSGGTDGETGKGLRFALSINRKYWKFYLVYFPIDKIPLWKTA